jgi:multidrug efflux pump
MVPLGTLATLPEISGAADVTRYNLYTAAAITGNLRTGFSSGDAIKAVERISNRALPLSIKADWTESMFMQKRAGNASNYVLDLSIVCVFLALVGVLPAIWRISRRRHCEAQLASLPLLPLPKDGKSD